MYREPDEARLTTESPRCDVPLVLRCQKPKARDDDHPGVADRQARVPGFSQEALSELTILLVGAGALGGEIAAGLVRKGVGVLKILDFDTVDLSNLSRQFFLICDVGSPKAWALARNLQPHGAMGTRILAWNLSFENALGYGVDLSCDVAISAVDDGDTRSAIARFAREQRVPAIIGAASEQADYANLFIQEVRGTCYWCGFPGASSEGRTPCPGSPAIKDLFMQLGGLAVYAVDTLFMERPRAWNLHSLCPADATFTMSARVEPRPDCPVCGGASP
jgi:molybdopterin/thiamine biosynthesis adenylyltransferase